LLPPLRFLRPPLRFLRPPLRFLRPPHRFTHVAFLVGVSVCAIRASEVHLRSWDKGMPPDLVTSRLAVDRPAGSTQVTAELAKLAWYATPARCECHPF